jgi:hypothetical protein
MPQRMRKLIGTVVLLVFLACYSLLAMALAAAVLPGAGGLMQFVYYAVCGLAWVLPAGVLVRWMQRSDPVN